MIRAVTGERWKTRVGEYVKKRAYIYEELDDKYEIIGFVENDEIVGGLLFSDYDGHNIWVHLALEHLRVCKRSFIKMLFEYCFNMAKCGRITAMCKNGYERNERLLKGVGFTKEGVVRKVMKIDDEFVDGAIYGILKEDCKWV